MFKLTNRKIMISIYLVLMCLNAYVETKQSNEDLIQATVEPRPPQQKQKITKQADIDLVTPDIEQQPNPVDHNTIFYKPPEDAQPEKQSTPPATSHTGSQSQSPSPTPSPTHSIKQVSTQSQDSQQVQFQIDPLTEPLLQKQQQQLEQLERQQEQKKLSSWIAEEMDRITEADQIRTHQIFAFQIGGEGNDNSKVQFKWNPTQFKSGPLKFVVEVFRYDRGDITFPDNPEEDEYVQVFTQPENSSMFMNLGRVYLKRMFTINFFSDYQDIRLQNHYPQRMLIQLSLQATKFVPQKALKDDKLKIPAQKIKSILEQLQQTQKKRQKTYRSQWGLRDRQQHHQSEMLILTGVELIVILATAIVQIYCIKNLFDNRLIV